MGTCGRCEKKLKSLLAEEPRCMKCGKPLRSMEQEYCRDCGHTKHIFDQGAALWLHKEPVNLSVYQFKFHNQRAFGRFYAAEMAKRFKAELIRWKPELILPVPLHPSKRRKRGYNQAAIVAKELGRLTGIAVDVKLLKRVRGTTPQKSLNPEDRKRNIAGAFSLGGGSKDLRRKRVLLIDDIYTTGSTMDEAAKVLKKAGAEKVFYLTISIGQGY